MMWPLYLGPQQQLEPSGKGSGLWADPEPRVDVKDVSFIDVKAHSGSWPAAAAVVRCPRSNPCRGLRFEDVSLDANVFGKGRAYVCDHRDAAFGVVAGERAPDAADVAARRRVLSSLSTNLSSLFTTNPLVGGNLINVG